MDRNALHDGTLDGLTPLESLDLSQIKSFADLLHAMRQTAFAGRQLGEAFEILVQMMRDAETTVVLTLSGAMTVAKQGRIICELIDRGLVQAIVATGALMAHGLTESIGLTHYQYDPTMDDRELFAKGYNRIYDTLEMEANLNNVERLVREVLDHNAPEDGVWSSARFCRAVGRRLDELDAGVGILRSAYLREVPVFVPAFTDSEMGLDFSTWAMSKALQGAELESLTPEEIYQAVPSYNPFLDLQEYARLIGRARTLGIFTIGGGVPRNWAQQVAPYFDITNYRIGTGMKAPRFKYGVRICPEPVHWGGLSGCTYSEGVSWGKFMPPEEGGRFAEVMADATAVWPLLMKAVFEELDRQG
ncbi:MAG TPA: deoxyhypusine synthase family protein [Candidatus Sumerlaeota bacterium]|nr:MAG: putative deoxyhypusine synthase [candidate division BRC1 bacterium ADurb.BinA292]HOE97727.1 deoxyhypusine synthase family protein [Candidatus Sumerlaeota bacterium]HPK01826.1 deoxyhypusine synthase family protein [Candidatus Sumerlaeota bacterium]